MSSAKCGMTRPAAIAGIAVTLAFAGASRAPLQAEEPAACGSRDPQRIGVTDSRAGPAIVRTGFAGYPYFDPPRIEALAVPDELSFGIAHTCPRTGIGELSLFRMAQQSYFALPNASEPGDELGTVMHF